MQKYAQNTNAVLVATSQEATELREDWERRINAQMARYEQTRDDHDFREINALMRGNRASFL